MIEAKFAVINKKTQKIAALLDLRSTAEMYAQRLNKYLRNNWIVKEIKNGSDG